MEGQFKLFIIKVSSLDNTQKWRFIVSVIIMNIDFPTQFPFIIASLYYSFTQKKDKTSNKRKYILTENWGHEMKLNQ